MKFTKATSKTEKLFTDHRKSAVVVQQAEIKMARAFARIKRADRVRKSLSATIAPSEAALMGITCELEALSYKQLAILPGVRRHFAEQQHDLYLKLIKDTQG
jgi:hypothetical protein